MDVHALVGGAGRGRLRQRGGVEDALGASIYCCLEEKKHNRVVNSQGYEIPTAVIYYAIQLHTWG